MVEESIPMFEAFCQHHDVATLAADQQHIGLYEEIVRTYASYGALKTPFQPKGGVSAPTAIRWRSAGLRALKSITSSEAVGADGGRQMNMIMPIILQNLHSGDQEYLRQLHRRTESADLATEKQSVRRRMSVATVQNSEGSSRPTSATLNGTADDADRLAEEEVGILAVECLKQIFVANNRAQIRIATGAMLKFVCMRVPHQRPSTAKTSKSSRSGTWATTLIEMVTRWTPVQDRFVILVTIMETLVRSPVAEENLEQQLLLVSLVGWLLRSDINMIGLSVMDVLLGLVQHILLLLQLGGKGSNVLPHHQQTDAIDLFKGTEDLIDGPISPSKEKIGEKAEESLPSSNRQELLLGLQRCIGDLSTHVYYSDQISDMITAILLRLKPSPMSSITTAAAAVEHPQAAAKAILDSVHLRENPETDEFFSFGTARVTALKAIKEVLTVANIKGTPSSGAAIGRNRVAVQVWEGTQWLLRDDDRRVRRAYVDALLTWLKLEMSSNDLRVNEDKRKLVRSVSKSDVNSSRRETMILRATSSASHRGNSSKISKSTFLQLLHLAIYDDAIETPESEPDVLLLHLLLVNLVNKLGVNAVKTGLPMIIRLQEDINIDKIISTPIAKMNIGSLVHGYFSALCDRFEFDTSSIGFAIQHEISRRKEHDLWLDTIQFPPLPIDQIMTAASHSLSAKRSLQFPQQQSLNPFDGRPAMVDRIAESYARIVASPPTSPPLSPGRVFSMPISFAHHPDSSSPADELPLKIREAMLSDWSKDICIATIEKESARTISLNGSKRGTNLSQYLGVNSNSKGSTRDASPSGANTPARYFSSETNATTHNHASSAAFQIEHRQSSIQDTNSASPVSSSDQNQTLRVDDLKQALVGGSVPNRGASPLRHSTNHHDFGSSNGNGTISSDSDSVVSAEGLESASEGDLSRSVPQSEAESAHAPLTISTETPKTQIRSNHTASGIHSRSHSNATHPRSRPQSGATDPDKPSTPRSLRRPSTSSSGEDPSANAAALRGEIVHPRLSIDGSVVEDEVPPVPPLPAGVFSAPRPISTGQVPPQIQQQYIDGIKSGSGKDKQRASMGRKRGVDVQALLGSIDAVSVGDNRGSISGGKPPF